MAYLSVWGWGWGIPHVCCVGWEGLWNAQSTVSEARVSRKPITVVKFGPIGDYVAVGCADSHAYVYTVNMDDGTLEKTSTCKGNTSYVCDWRFSARVSCPFFASTCVCVCHSWHSAITHIDWDESEVSIQTNSTGYELLFFTGETCVVWLCGARGHHMPIRPKLVSAPLHLSLALLFCFFAFLFFCFCFGLHWSASPQW